MDWSDKWQLAINIGKCAVLTLGSRHGRIASNYFINNVKLLNADSVVDLGILTDNVLSYHAHIHNIVVKATQRVGVLFRGFMSRELKFLRKAFITYVRPVLEYNSCVWNPHHKEYIALIENVQRRFTKRIPSLRLMSYPERLAMIDLEPLELRRLRTDLNEYYKCFHNLNSINYTEHFNFYVPPAASRSSSPKLVKPVKANNTVMCSFLSSS